MRPLLLSQKQDGYFSFTPHLSAVVADLTNPLTPGLNPVLITVSCPGEGKTIKIVGDPKLARVTAINRGVNETDRQGG